MKSVNAEIRSDCSFYSPALMNCNSHYCAVLRTELRLDLRMTRVSLEIRGSSKLHDYLDSGDQDLVSRDLPPLSELFLKLGLAVLLHHHHLLFVSSLQESGVDISQLSSRVELVSH